MIFQWIYFMHTNNITGRIIHSELLNISVIRRILDPVRPETRLYLHLDAFSDQAFS